MVVLTVITSARFELSASAESSSRRVRAPLRGGTARASAGLQVQVEKWRRHEFRQSRAVRPIPRLARRK